MKSPIIAMNDKINYWLYLLVVIKLVYPEKPGFCYNSAVSDEEYCCQHFFLNDTVCVECPAGYTSDNGSECAPCDDPKYGRKCSDICYCSKKERCDHVNGCVQDAEVGDNVSSDLSTSTLNTTDPSKDRLQRTTLLIDRPSKNSIDLKNNEQEHTTPSNGKSFHSILIYILCTGGLAVCVAVAVLFRKRIEVVCFQDKPTSGDRRNVEMAENTANTFTGNTELEDDNVYDLIDETNIITDFEMIEYTSCN